MSPLAEQLVQTEAHRSIFESSVRQLPLPVCTAFGASAQPQPVSFQSTGRTLSTKDSSAVQQEFPRSVAASSNLVLTSSGNNPNAA
ncbi:MAG TPA: diphosphate--fructose-6-phosphate 1-phosphotransferase, partial [Accumulibacter sp.]|nr:diphosphate--fructose-6-phosphate 1-phosphotransferase [Accumulibacter sp.]